MTDEQKQKMAKEGECQINMFQKQEIRKVLHKNEWWFSVKDVIEALVETVDGNGYVRKLRSRDEGLKSTWGQIVLTLPFESETRGKQQTNFVNVEGLFRIMQSVSTKKAEPFKKWLAKVGFERIQELKNPEIAVKRAIAIYRAKGYPSDWIDARIMNKVSRDSLVEEWKNRGVEDGMQYGILTNAIHVETFNLGTKEHKKIKGLKSQNLRDNMTPLELTLTTLGEQTAKAIGEAEDAQGFHELHDAAKSAGQIAGDARKKIEEKTKIKVVSDKNYLTTRQRKNNIEKLPDGFDETMQRLLKVPPFNK